jgi:hypothetical protein
MNYRQPSEPNRGLERARHQLRSEGVKDLQRNPLRSGVHTRGYLPHVKREGASYFVTFRLADSLPKEVLLRFEHERAERLRWLNSSPDAAERDVDAEVNRDFQRQIERYLDRGAGSCHLRRDEIAELVVNAMKHFHEQRYLLHEWVVMPNHVHALLWPKPNNSLSEILKSWKQFTSRRAKKILNLSTEPFWQPESYDHWIRDEEEKLGSSDMFATTLLRPACVPPLTIGVGAVRLALNRSADSQILGGLRY